MTDRFKKNDQGKPRFSIVCDLMDELGLINNVMEFGAAKYGRDNWKQAPTSSRYVDAGIRHLLQARGTTPSDDESGMPHLAHAACNILFAMYIDKEKDAKG